MIHRRGPSCDQTQFTVWWKFDLKFCQRTTAGSCDDRVWSTGERMRGTGAIVFSTRVYFILPETVELYSCEDSSGRSTYVSVLTSSLMRYVCCGESDNVLVVGAPHIRIYSANRRWIQLLDEHLKHFRRWEQLSRGTLSTVGRAQSIQNATPLDLQSLQGSWSGRYRIRRCGPVRRSRGGSTDGDDTMLAGKLSVVQVHQNYRRNMRKLYSTTNCWSF